MSSIIDIHCHPALKTWLFPSHHVYDEKVPTGYEFSENCFVNIAMMEIGDVSGAVSVYYIPEHGILKLDIKDKWEKIGMAVLKLVCGRLHEIVEDKTSTSGAFLQTQKYIKMFEDDIAKAKDVMGKKVDIARSYSDILRLGSDGWGFFLHSIEGAHGLGCKTEPTDGSDPVEISQEELLGNIQWVFDAGVCQITLGHFFENILVSSSGGIPKKMAGELGYVPKGTNTYPLEYNGDLAIAAVDKMLELGIIIDLTHCAPGAKQMVFDRNNLRGDKKRPLVYAHTGIQSVALAHHPEMKDTSPEFLAYLPDDKDIAKIKDCNGVLGIIFMDYWLSGDDNYQAGLAAVIETIVAISKVPDSAGNANTYDHIAIGSDLDGFTTVPKDLGGDLMMRDVIAAIKNIPGITDDDVDKICRENYLRVLKNGWGKL